MPDKGAFADERPCIAYLFCLLKIYRHSAWTSGARPAVAGTLTLKQCSRVHQNTPILFKKLEKIKAFSPDPIPRRREMFLALNPTIPSQNPKYDTARRIKIDYIKL